MPYCVSRDVGWANTGGAGKPLIWKPAAGFIIVPSKDGAEMVWVRGGWFRMEPNETSCYTGFRTAWYQPRRI